jgi:AcrR family transcriptional regulator
MISPYRSVGKHPNGLTDRSASRIVPMADDRATRQRILDAAAGRFAVHGYAGTSVAHIAADLGISKAALYHHFRSKAEILAEIVGTPMAAFDRLAALADGLPAAELLAGIIDTTADARALSTMLGNDPSVQEALKEQTAYRDADRINATFLAALTRPGRGAAAAIRARAALTVAKQTTLALAAGRDKPLSKSDRAEILAAALRALQG